jgi:hypothetical protein
MAACSMLWKPFTAALAIRWVYTLLLFAILGDDGLQTLDSTTYITYALLFVENSFS